MSRATPSSGADGAPARPAAPKLALAALMLAALVLAAGVTAQSVAYLNHDVAWTLYSAGRLLEGARMYEQIVDINPPLAWWLSAPIVAAARWLDASPIVVFRGAMFAGILASLAACSSLAARLGLSAHSRGALVVALAFVLAVLPGDDFGQREHWMLVLTFPLLLLASRSSAGAPVARPARVAVGCIAGVGLALKPHFLLLPMLLSASQRWRHGGARHLRTSEEWGLLGVLLAYGAAIAWLTPEYLARIVGHAAATQGPYLQGWSTMLGRAAVESLPAVALALAVGAPRDAPQRRLDRVLILAAVSFAGAYLLQRKGWPYHRYPLQAVLVCCAGLRTAAWWQRAPSAWRGVGAALAAAALLAVPAAGLLDWQRAEARRRDPDSDFARLLSLIRAEATGSSLGFFATALTPAFPLVNYAEVDWASRFPFLWMLPAVATQPPTAGSLEAEIELAMRDAVVEDLERARPALIIVDERPLQQGLGGRIDYVGYFSTDPRFARIWSRYSESARVGGFVAYRAMPIASSAIPGSSSR